jgi:hypothetical protein
MALLTFSNAIEATHMGAVNLIGTMVNPITPQEDEEEIWGTGDVPDESVDWSKIKINGDRAPWVAAQTSQRPSIDNAQASQAFYEAISKAQTFWKTTPGYLQALA